MNHLSRLTKKELTARKGRLWACSSGSHGPDFIASGPCVWAEWDGEGSWLGTRVGHQQCPFCQGGLGTVIEFNSVLLYHSWDKSTRKLCCIVFIQITISTKCHVTPLCNAGTDGMHEFVLTKPGYHSSRGIEGAFPLEQRSSWYFTRLILIESQYFSNTSVCMLRSSFTRASDGCAEPDGLCSSFHGALPAYVWLWLFRHHHIFLLLLSRFQSSSTSMTLGSGLTPV